MFDIRKIAIGATAKMKVRDVDGEVVKGDDKKELTITVYGPGSKEFIQAKSELQAALMEEMTAAKEAEKKGETYTPDPQKSEERTAKFLANITASLDGFEYPGGPVALYQDPTLGHIAEDLDKFVMKRGNFKKGSAVGS